MREGLRSSTLLKGGRRELDLNADPPEKLCDSLISTEPQSHQDSDSYSIQTELEGRKSKFSSEIAAYTKPDAGLVTTNSASTKKLKREENSAMLIEDDLTSTKYSALPSPVGNVKIDMGESGSMECSVDANAYPNVDANVRGDHCIVRAQHRKKWKKTEVQTGYATVCERNLGKNQLPMVSSDLVSMKEEPLIFPREAESGELCVKLEDNGSRKPLLNDSIDSKVLEIGKDVSNEAIVSAEVHVDANCNVDEGKDKLVKSRRGRKRKRVENTKCLEHDEGKRKLNHLHLAGTNGNVGKVLRSRIIAITPEIHLNTENIGFAGEKTKQEIDHIEFDYSNNKSCRTRNYEVAPLIGKGNRKKKGHRGRPPKLPIQSSCKMVINQKGKLIGSKKTVKHRMAGCIAKSSKFVKSQLEEVGLNDEKKMVMKSKTYGNNTQKGEMKRREQKQAIRDQIIDILKKAGWTIEYRPRLGRDYSDAIYIDCEGKQHWSVTKAYRKLKEKVEGGMADDKSLAAFTLIPDEVLGTLFRITEKGKKKLIQNRKSTKKSVCTPQHKEKLKANQNTFRKKIKMNAYRKPCALLARSSCEVSDQSGDGFVGYDGKRNLLSWMIDLGTIPSNAEVQYMNGRRTRVMCDGKITRDGICCECCGKTVTLLEFESHAGSKLGQPLKHICLASGTSLLQCLVYSWSKLEETNHIGFHLVEVNGDDPNDEACNICGDGGDLICCDGCPSTFHKSCLNIQKLPSGDWRCVYCSCKFCGTISGKSYEVKSSHHVDDTTNVSELSSCLLCEEKFHLACTQNEGSEGFDSDDLSFCGKGCKKLFKDLKVLLGVRHELEGGFSWTLLRRRDAGKDEKENDDSSIIECNTKLALAFSVMDECFLPIVDQRAKINMVHNVVFNCGSNFRRLNYDGFYTFILENGDELVCAASIRLHGNLLAEMPFIGTRYMYRRKGMCRQLLTAIEMALLALGVETLVIPAIPELIETWTKVFGFMPLEESKRREMRHMSMLVFPGTDMLQKPLLKHQDTEGQGTSTGQKGEASAPGDTLTTCQSPNLLSNSCDAHGCVSVTVESEQISLVQTFSGVSVDGS